MYVFSYPVQEQGLRDVIGRALELVSKTRLFPLMRRMMGTSVYCRVIFMPWNFDIDWYGQYDMLFVLIIFQSYNTVDTTIPIDRDWIIFLIHSIRWPACFLLTYLPWNNLLLRRRWIYATHDSKGHVCDNMGNIHVMQYFWRGNNFWFFGLGDTIHRFADFVMYIPVFFHILRAVLINDFIVYNFNRY